jgi:hypothetical protein
MGGVLLLSLLLLQSLLQLESLLLSRALLRALIDRRDDSELRQGCRHDMPEPLKSQAESQAGALREPGMTCLNPGAKSLATTVCTLKLLVYATWGCRHDMPEPWRSSDSQEPY